MPDGVSAVTGMPEHAHRAATHRQPRDRRVDHTTPGFVRPPDPQTEGVGTGAGGGASGQDTGAAWDNRSEGCPEDPAQAHPLTPADPHPHAWADLGTPGLHGSVCRLCGETQID